MVLSTDLKGHNLKVMGILFTKRVIFSIIFILLLYYYIRKTVMALHLFYGGRNGVMILAVNASKNHPLEIEVMKTTKNLLKFPIS